MNIPLCLLMWCKAISRTHSSGLFILQVIWSCCHIPSVLTQLISLVPKDEGRRFFSAKLHGIRFQMAVNLDLIAMRTTYHVYSNAGWGFFLKFDAKISEVLNLYVKHHQDHGKLDHSWTGPWGAEPRPANHVYSTLLWDITQCRTVIPYQNVGTAYRSQHQGSRNWKERTEHNWS